MGYHLSKINRGNYGEFSKIKEETEELEDSIKQNNKIMQLVELSDLIGAIEGFLNNNFAGIYLEDLIIMKDATKKSFKDGTRKSRNEE